MSQTSLATITGTMLVPGVSRNNRLYTKMAIGKGVQRMKERLADPNGLPIVMRTHHDAGDDSTKIVGRITDVWQEADGSATYKAKLFNTERGRDLAPLITPDENGMAALRTTSIHGFWVGPTEAHRQGNGRVETGDDLEINAIDFTASPGVPGARVQSVTFESTDVKWPVEGANVHDGHNIFESMEAKVSFEEDDEPMDEADYNTKQRQSMASKGQAMPGGRYPIANKSDLRNAIHAVGRGKGSHAAIRAHIVKRAKALGLAGMIPGNWTNATNSETTSVTYHLQDGDQRTDLALAEAERIYRFNAELADDDAPIESYIKMCIGNANGEIMQVCADNIDPSLIKKAAKKAGGIARDIMAGRDDSDEDDDNTTDADSIQFHVVMLQAPDTTSEDPNDTVDNGGGYQQSKETTIATEPPIEESAMSETAAADAAPVTEAIDYDKLATTVAKTVAESFADMLKAKADAKAAKKADKASKKADKTAESTATDAETKKATDSKGLKESITADELKNRLAEERKATITELRETLLKESGLPQRQGFRADEKDGEASTGDALWARRGEVWQQVAPSLYPPAAA